ncbi:hypothetical protein Thivi_3502 [Thiocystis violascens DSM 198]|uniref:Uncharacterized protein n=1 Tax=Thiocystis violascens (strain ATCC 17096 / DSM 198 / 6111) TaxID=765911 RepID=I3YEF1_THIV6|nr:hypothetical protein Thivi_3502 [Thiocystis violascens DSM 198]
MATADSTNPDTFYRDCLQCMLAADEKLVQLVRRELDGVRITTEDVAQRLKRLAVG